MTRIGYGVSAGVIVAALAAGFFWWRSASSPTPPAPTSPTPEVVTALPPAPAPSVAEPAVRYPIEAPPMTSDAASAASPGEDSDPSSRFRIALNGLMGPTAVLRWMQPDDFARRLVATVDNLTGTHAPARLWPVNPTPGRFSPSATPQGPQLDTANHERYAAFVGLVESVDSRSAVAVYRELYPMFQRAYLDLGYPGRHFNDRLVDVIDHLLATPEPTTPLAVQLVEVKGSVPSVRPWVRYEFADPEHEARSAGQKLLLRMGPDQQRRLKAKLAEVRRLVTQPARPGG